MRKIGMIIAVIVFVAVTSFAQSGQKNTASKPGDNLVTSANEQAAMAYAKNLEFQLKLTQKQYTVVYDAKLACSNTVHNQQYGSPAYVKAIEDCDKKIVAVLTIDQRKQYDKLQPNHGKVKK